MSLGNLYTCSFCTFTASLIRVSLSLSWASHRLCVCERVILLQARWGSPCYLCHWWILQKTQREKTACKYLIVQDISPRYFFTQFAHTCINVFSILVYFYLQALNLIVWLFLRFLNRTWQSTWYILIVSILLMKTMMKTFVDDLFFVSNMRRRRQLISIINHFKHY